MVPETKYAKSGEVSIAYKVVGDGPVDLILVFGFISHIELFWTALAPFFERLASFSRLIMFDKRGVGLSDPVEGVPTLEDRMDDVRAVMDAAGSTEAVIVGISEGAAMASLFAATYPYRTKALVLYGAVVRATWAPDFPWATERDALVTAGRELIEPYWGQGVDVEIFAPSVQDDPRARELTAQVERLAASPSMVRKLFQMFLDVDVRHVLPVITAQTLILHRRGDRVVNIRAARWIAEQIPGARLVELDGIDHNPWVGDAESVLGEIEEFVTGTRRGPEPDRVLATVMFTDIVGSTERASELGDSAWRALLQEQHAITRSALGRFRGKEIKTMGDGFLATFDGPARAVQCALSLAPESEAAGCPLRIGLHTGEVEIIGDDVGGIAVHTAARIAALADTGEILVSRTVTDLVAGSDLPPFEDRGRHALKGIPREWELFAVTR